MTMNLFEGTEPNYRGFKTLFWARESSTFSIRSFRFWLLILILLLAFMTIGLSNGSIRVLNDKMRDPFVNWADIEIPYAMSDSIAGIQNELNTDSLKNKYRYSEATGRHEYLLRLRKWNTKSTRQVLGWTINSDNVLLNKILNEENLISGRHLRDDKDISLIVSKRLLDTLGYPDTVAVVYMAFSIGEDKEDMLSLPISAVVEELPGRAWFLSTPYLYGQKYYFDGVSPFNVRGDHTLYLFSAGGYDKAMRIRDEIDSCIELSSKYKILDLYVSHPKTDTSSYIDGYTLALSSQNESFNVEMIEELSDYLINKLKSNKRGVLRVNKYRFKDHWQLGKYDRLSINFTELSYIRRFRDFLFNNYGVEINMEKVEALENFNLVAGLTSILSAALIIFCVIAVSLFVSNIFESHLKAISRHLGTLKAFGVSNRELMIVYLSMAYQFLGYALLISFAVSIIIGVFQCPRIVLSWMFTLPESKMEFFQLLGCWETYCALAAIIGTSVIWLYIKGKGILKHTPGDLINDRIHT